MGALLCFVNPGLTWFAVETRRGAGAADATLRSSCGAPRSGRGGTVKVDANAETGELWLSVEVVRWLRPCSLPARCLSACESWDGSYGVECQRDVKRAESCARLAQLQGSPH